MRAHHDNVLDMYRDDPPKTPAEKLAFFNSLEARHAIEDALREAFTFDDDPAASSRS